jgi:hypothetical protein
VAGQRRQADACHSWVGWTLSGLRVRRRPERLRTRPRRAGVVHVEHERLRMDTACQLGREEVALGAGPTPGQACQRSLTRLGATRPQ